MMILGGTTVVLAVAVLAGFAEAGFLPDRFRELENWKPAKGYKTPSEATLNLLRNKPTEMGPFLRAMAQGADINYKSIEGHFPLACASTMNGDPVVVQAMLDAGANIDEVDNYDQTALHFAAHFNSRDIARVLLENGADPWIRTHKVELTAYELARRVYAYETGALIMEWMKKPHPRVKAKLERQAEERRKAEQKRKAAAAAKAKARANTTTTTTTTTTPAGSKGKGKA